MKYITVVLFVIAHVGAFGAVLIGEADAQDSPDCTACAQECADIARDCRAAADARFEECTGGCFTEGCVRNCRSVHEAELAPCDRQQSSCISNCYI